MRRGFLIISLTLGLALQAQAGAPLARMVAPAEGTKLVAGELTWLAWEEAVGSAGSPAIEEWEAFLSLDGGDSFPFRLTPHLSTADSRVLFRVPSYASSNVRFLLRFGDERQEHEVEVAARFEIVAAAWQVPHEPTTTVKRRGEAARAGDSGTVAWVEGDRQGRELRRVTTGVESPAWSPRPRPALWAVALATAQLSTAPGLVAPSSRPATPEPETELHHPPKGPRARVVRCLLTLHQRLNT